MMIQRIIPSFLEYLERFDECRLTFAELLTKVKQIYEDLEN